MKKDSVALWYKDGREIKVNEKLDFSEGVLTLEITQVSSVSHVIKNMVNNSGDTYGLHKHLIIKHLEYGQAE